MTFAASVEMGKENCLGSLFGCLSKHLQQNYTVHHFAVIAAWSLACLDSFCFINWTKHDDYAKLKPCVVIGSVRRRLPVAVNTAFAIAGRIGGNVGSLKSQADCWI